ncbi:uncharacterized protein LOC127530192 isoform X1 [Acanthochromis polyacanthus]|uniref:uncharacterized protein LOC127530192 isoform X1 n=1 Tax=Acanthochromis polyacanthus TaxID=80966 RepID=UPI00223488AA|nr:uncharacterized protein LOC127530192 isoform X1 [Acanthochromis polyacanthus]
MASTSSSPAQLSLEVAHLAGVHRDRYVQKLELAGLETDPYLLPPLVFEDLINSPVLPEFTPHDLYHYVINAVSPYTGADLKAYKSLDAYQFFVAGWVTGTKCYAYSGGTQYLIMAKVHHSQSLSEAPLKPWVSLKKDGTVTCGHCTCKAGLGEVCSHIAALLYALDSAVKRLEEKSCTDGPRQWGLPPVKAGKALYEEATGIDFSNPLKKHNNKSNKSYKKRPAKKIKVSMDATEKFYKDLDGAASTASEKSGLLSILPGYCDQFQAKVISLKLPQPLTELYNPHNRKLSASDLMMKCDEVFTKMGVTLEQAVKVEEETRQQGQSRLWFDMRAGRVTASRFKSAARTDPSNPSKSLIRQICYPDQSRFSTVATRHVCQTYKHLSN